MEEIIIGTTPVRHHTQDDLFYLIQRKIGPPQRHSGPVRVVWVIAGLHDPDPAASILRETVAPFAPKDLDTSVVYAPHQEEIVHGTDIVDHLQQVHAPDVVDVKEHIILGIGLDIVVKLPTINEAQQACWRRLYCWRRGRLPSRGTR